MPGVQEPSKSKKISKIFFALFCCNYHAMVMLEVKGPSDAQVPQSQCEWPHVLLLLVLSTHIHFPQLFDQN